MRKFDVIVCGGGPAGTSAAKHLADLGFKTVVVEALELGRDKACGGIIPPRVIRHLGELPEESFSRRFDGYNVFAPDMKNVISRFHKPGYVVERSAFDRFLVEMARNSGAEIIERFWVNDVSDSDGKLIISDGNERFSCDFLVAADGVNSTIKRLMSVKGFPDEDLALGIQYDFALDQDIISERLEDYFEVFYTGFIKKGYGWISPFKDFLRVGLGSCDRDFKIAAREHLDRFCNTDYIQKRINGGVNFRYSTHLIPLGGQMHELAKDRVLFTGDAAGFVWPMTGEGIYPAIEAGPVVAEAIESCFDRPDEVPLVYKELCRRKGLLRFSDAVNDRGHIQDVRSCQEYVDDLSLSSFQNP